MLQKMSYTSTLRQGRMHLEAKPYCSNMKKTGNIHQNFLESADKERVNGNEGWCGDRG